MGKKEFEADVMGVGEAKPAGPDIILVFRNIDEKSIKSMQDLNRSIFPGNVLKWVKKYGEELDRSALAKAKYVCTFEATPSDDELKGLFLRE